jgi:hypothetical protein
MLAGCDPGPLDLEPKVTKSEQAVTQKTCWTQVPLPGSDPDKKTKTICGKFFAGEPPPEVLERQQRFREALASHQGRWRDLTPAQRDARRQQLKDSIFNSKGGK